MKVEKLPLIICPFAAEAKLLAGLLPGCRQINSTAWQSSIARVKAINAAGEKALLDFMASCNDWQDSPQLILFGAAGALAPGIEPGQIFVCNTVSFEQERLDLSPNYGRSHKQQETTSPTIAQGTGLIPAGIGQVTVRKPVLSSNERLILYKQTGAALVDMESYFFGREAIKHGCKPLVVRFVSDTAAQPFKLPFAANVRVGVIKARQQILNLINLPQV